MGGGGGSKTYLGGKRTRERTLQIDFWAPPKELLVCSVLGLCKGRTEQRHLGGVENVLYKGVLTPFWEGCPS